MVADDGRAIDIIDQTLLPHRFETRRLETLEDAAERVSEHFLPLIAQPMLVVAGDKDGFTPRHTSDVLMNLLPAAEFELIPGGSHISPVEFPTQIIERIHRFLADHGLGQPGTRPGPSGTSWGENWTRQAASRD